MSETRRPDVVVVGAGIIGASLAFRLAQAGVAVVIVDRAQPAAGATGSSFAYANASRKVDRPYFDLNLGGLQAHRKLCDELGGAPWLIEGGRMVWVTDEAAATDLHHEATRVAGWGYPVEWLDRCQVRELEPHLRLEDDVTQAMLYTEEMAVDAPLLTQTLIAQAERHGAKTRFGQEVAALQRSNGRVAGITMADGEIIWASTVVNCAGPDGDRVAALAGRHLPLRARAGLVVRATGGAGAVSRIAYGPRVQMRPDGRDNGLLLLHDHPIDEALESGERPEQLAEALVERARGYLPGSPGLRVAHRSVGIRPIPADGFPSVGLLPAIPGYGEIVTHSGVTLGPLLGKLVTDEIVSGRVDPLLAPYRPERFDHDGQGRSVGPRFADVPQSMALS